MNSAVPVANQGDTTVNSESHGVESTVADANRAVTGVGEAVDVEITGVSSTDEIMDEEPAEITGVDDTDEDTVLDGNTASEERGTGDIAHAGEDGSGNHIVDAVVEPFMVDGSVAPEHAESVPAESMEDVSGVGAKVETDIEAIMDERYGRRSGHYNLRPHRKRNLDRWNDAALTCYGSDVHKIDGVVHTQHYIHQGLKLFGKAGEDAITTELKQLHLRQVLEPMYGDSLTVKEKEDALPYLMFLKKKHTGQIKGRGCADGRRQRIYMQKEDTSLPTVAIESLFISAMLDALERHDVATVDIPGAFMQADMVGNVHMKLEGRIADLLTELEPGLYKKYVKKLKGKSIMYVKLKKALY